MYKSSFIHALWTLPGVESSVARKYDPGLWAPTVEPEKSLSVDIVTNNAVYEVATDRSGP